MTTSQLGLDSQRSYFGAQRSFPNRTLATSNGVTDQRQQFPSFKSELAAQASSESEQDSSTSAGAQSGKPNAAAHFNQQTIELPPHQAPSSFAVKPGLSVFGASPTQNVLVPADLKQEKNSRGTTSASPTDQARSPKQPVSRDRATKPEDPNSPHQLSPNKEMFSQSAVENTGTPNETAVPTGKPADAKIAEPTQVDHVGASKSTAVQGDLAIALQIRTGQQDPESAPSTVSDEAQTANTLASPTTGSVKGDGLGAAIACFEKPEHRAPEAVQAAAPVIYTPAHTQNGEENASSAPEVKPANPAEFQTQLEKSSTEPVRGAHVQIAGENNQKVDVRLFERNGALSVTVRSGDPGLTRALQDHAPELTTRLSSDHFRTETWTPDIGKHSETSNSREGNSQKHGTGTRGEQDSNQGRDNKGHRQQPGWIDELEAHPVPFFRKG